MVIKVIRETYTEDTTVGVVLVDGKFFGYCLEDVVRGTGIKVHGKTAIPAGRYEVIVNQSNRFKREMPLLLNVTNFEGIRIHGGNTHEDTEGCLLIAKNRVSNDRIQGSLESVITGFIKFDASKGIKSYVEILNTVK
jgi:hypothetical protein